MSLMSAAFEAQGLSVNLGGRSVLKGIDLRIAQGRWTCVVGPNGAGKSTLLRALAGLLPHQGQVLWQGARPAELTRRDRARRLSWLGQSEPVAEDLCVLDVVLLGRLPHQDWLAAPGARDRQAVESALRAVHAWDWRDRLLGQLSGGERQRVLLARALAVDAPLMLMDEPLAHLDPPHQADWLERVQCLKAKGVTLLSVLHEIGVALHADDVVVMQAGCVMHQGPCGDAFSHRAIEAVFDQRLAIHAVGSQWAALPVSTPDGV